MVSTRQVCSTDRTKLARPYYNVNIYILPSGDMTTLRLEEKDIEFVEALDLLLDAN